MKKIRLWTKTLRLSVTIPAGLLVHIGFSLNHQNTNWILVIEIFFIASLAMIHNDYIDRVNDLKKNRHFAYENPALFKKVIITGWTVVWLLAVFLLQKYLLLLAPVIIIATIYSYTRKIMYFQNFCVALTSASPIFITGPLNKINISIFFSIFLAIFSREFIKDIEDRESDIDWKFTPVSTGLFTKEEFLGHAGALMERCCVFLLIPIVTLLQEAHWVSKILLCLGWVLCGVASKIWFDYFKSHHCNIEKIGDFDNTLLTGKKIFDYGMMATVLGLIILRKL